MNLDLPWQQMSRKNKFLCVSFIFLFFSIETFTFKFGFHFIILNSKSIWEQKVVFSFFEFILLKKIFWQCISIQWFEYKIYLNAYTCQFAFICPSSIRMNFHNFCQNNQASFRMCFIINHFLVFLFWIKWKINSDCHFLKKQLSWA